jgi:hypothetical protein
MGYTNFPHGITSFGVPVMPVSGLGPGEVFHLVAAKASTDPYYYWLYKQGVADSHIFSTLASAYTNCTTNRGDNILVYPGTYTTTSELDWDKDNTTVYGMGGPQHSGFDMGTIITTSTATVGAVIHNTADKTKWFNVTITNQGAAATALTAFHNAGPGTRMVGCQIVGMLGATACDTALASSLQISANGYYFYAENCVIGTVNGQPQGSDTAAPIYFSGTGLASDGMFRKCLIQTQIAAATRPMIYVAAQSMGPGWIFDDCVLYAFAINHAVKMNQAVSDADIHTHDILFHNCAGVNITDWKTDDGMVWSSSPDAGTAGGIAVVST